MCTAALLTQDYNNMYVYNCMCTIICLLRSTAERYKDYSNLNTLPRKMQTGRNLVGREIHHDDEMRA